MKDLFPVRIGLLFGQAPAPHEEKELLEGLREHGLVAGDNLIIERRYAEGQLHLVPGYGRELASLNLDAVISTCTPTTRIVQQEFGTSPESTLAVLVDSSSKVHPRMVRAPGSPAQQRGIRLVQVEAGGKPGAAPLSSAFDAAVSAGAKGIFALPDEPFVFANRGTIVELAARHPTDPLRTGGQCENRWRSGNHAATHPVALCRRSDPVRPSHRPSRASDQGLIATFSTPSRWLENRS